MFTFLMAILYIFMSYRNDENVEGIILVLPIAMILDLFMVIILIAAFA